MFALAVVTYPNNNVVLALAVTRPPAVALAKLKAAAVLALTMDIFVF